MEEGPDAKEAAKRAFWLWKWTRRAALLLPFASAGSDTSALFLLLNQGVYQFVSLYLLLLFLRCVASPYVVALAVVFLRVLSFNVLVARAPVKDHFIFPPTVNQRNVFCVAILR